MATWAVRAIGAWTLFGIGKIGLIRLIKNPRLAGFCLGSYTTGAGFYSVAVKNRVLQIRQKPTIEGLMEWEFDGAAIGFAAMAHMRGMGKVFCIKY